MNLPHMRNARDSAALLQSVGGKMRTCSILKRGFTLAVLMFSVLCLQGCGEKVAFDKTDHQVEPAKGTDLSKPETETATPDGSRPEVNRPDESEFPPRESAPEGGGFAASGATEPKPITIPNGRRLTVRLLQTVSSKNASPGQRFEAELASPVVVNGVTLLPRSTLLRGHVTAVRASGRLHKPGYLRLTLDSVRTPEGKWVGIKTTSIFAQGKSHKKRNLTLIGGGTGVGAVIGAIAGGGKGAAIGALSGAGAGTAGAYVTGKKDVTFPAEHRLSFSTTREISIG
jgi:hypothetical protein